MQRYIVLVLSIFILSCSPVTKYRTLPEVIAWEGQIQTFEQMDKDEQYSPDAVLFAGSSSIKLWSTLEKDMAPYPVIQRGYGGAMLSDFAVYANRLIAPHKCSAIVIFIANDITGGKNDKSPREVAALFGDVLKTIRKTHPDTPVFWIAVTPTPSRWDVWNVIKDAGSRISKICENNKNTYYIHTDFAFLDENGKPRADLFREDKLHLNQKGYAIWTEIIKKELNKVIHL
jgi:hypothetical protein